MKIIQKKQEYYQVKVSFRTIDSLVEETGLLPDLIKIDVEGHEYSVLEGMKNTLKNVRPRIVLECEARHIRDFTVFDVFNYLLECGYKGYFLKSGRKNSLDQFDLEREQLSYFKNKKRLDVNYINNFIFE